MSDSFIIGVVLFTTLAVLSTAVLASITGYIWLAIKGDSLVLYSTMHFKNERHFRRFPFKYKVFLIAAVIGLFIFMYAGTETLLFWIPDAWGKISDEGEWVSTKSVVAFLFSSFGGFTMLHFIVRSTHERFFLKECQMWSSELEKIIDASYSPVQLRILAEKYKSTVEELSVNKRSSLIAGIDTGHLVPEAQTVQNYKRLTHIVNELIKNTDHMNVQK